MTFQVEFDRGTAIGSRLGCFLKRKKENCGALNMQRHRNHLRSRVEEPATSKGTFKLDPLHLLTESIPNHIWCIEIFERPETRSCAKKKWS